jgi:hypothetical protein
MDETHDSNDRMASSAGRTSSSLSRASACEGGETAVLPCSASPRPVELHAPIQTAPTRRSDRLASDGSSYPRSAQRRRHSP